MVVQRAPPDPGEDEMRTRTQAATAAVGLMVLVLAGCGNTGSPPADQPAAAATDTAPGEATNAAGEPVIIAQPEAGTVVGFSAICTHMGCTVAPDGAELKCPCHGSVYEAATGTNIDGPAPRPLDAFNVKVDGDQVVEA